MATTNDLKNGLVLNLDGQLWSVVEFQHVKPGKGGAFVRTKLKNVLSGKVVDKTFNAGTKVETATVDKRDMQYLYKEGADFVFMDPQTYDQLHVPAETVGDAANFLLENQDAVVALHEGQPLYVELPASVELAISYTEPGLQGDRSTGGTKPATLETGAEIAVPLFITTGEKVKVDTRDGGYLGRVTGASMARPQQGPQARAGRAVRVRASAASRRSATLAERVAAADPPVNEYTVELVEGVVAHADRIDELLDDVLRGLDAGPDAGRRPHHPAARRPSSCCGATTCPTPSC